MLETIKRNYKYFLKYMVVGVSGTILDVGGFYLLLTFTSINRFVAATFTFIIAVINNYTWNKRWTFRDKNKNIPKQFTTFFMVAVIGLSLNLFFLWVYSLILTGVLTNTGFLDDAVNLPPWLNTIAKLGASGTVLIYNFLANRFITFKNAIPKPPVQSSAKNHTQ